jgi:hypothetical protein
VALAGTEALARRRHHTVQRSEVGPLREDPNGHRIPLGYHRLYAHVQIGELGQQPLRRLAHGLGSVHLAGSTRREGRGRMLDELLRHDLVADGEVLSVEDLLEVASNELLVGLGDRDPPSPSCPTQRGKYRHAARTPEKSPSEAV